MSVLANYAAERRIIEEFLHGEIEQRILLLRGVSGSGKTSLLRACLDATPRGVTLIPFQARESAVGVAEILYRVVEEIGPRHFQRFAAQVAQFQATPTVQVGKNIAVGRNQVSVALQAENPTDRHQRQSALTAAWFEDVQAWGQALILVVDTFEQATRETQEWLAGPFLARVGRPAHAHWRVLIAGQATPEAHNIEWGGCCQARELLGVPTGRDWLPVVQALHRVIPAENPETWLDGLCHGFAGLPDPILKIIDALPRVEARL